MRFVASVPDISFIPAALASGADVIEVRLDLTGPVSPEEANATFRDLTVPLIFTVRSAAEGGMFAGGACTRQEPLPCALRASNSIP